LGDKSWVLAAAGESSFIVVFVTGDYNQDFGFWILDFTFTGKTMVFGKTFV
jgi:hypothetical protein